VKEERRGKNGSQVVGVERRKNEEKKVSSPDVDGWRPSSEESSEIGGRFVALWNEREGRRGRMEASSSTRRAVLLDEEKKKNGEPYSSEIQEVKSRDICWPKEERGRRSSVSRSRRLQDRRRLTGVVLPVVRLGNETSRPAISPRNL